jgi:hypothetical protein
MITTAQVHIALLARAQQFVDAHIVERQPQHRLYALRYESEYQFGGFFNPVEAYRHSPVISRPDLVAQRNKELGTND